MADYSVLIPIVNTDSGDALLMEVRSLLVKQPGEVCFPGGRIEKGETPEAAAVRETCEELGLDPEDIRIISEPKPEIMSDGRRVWSVRAMIGYDAFKRIKPSEDEVAEVFLLPVRWLECDPPEHYDLAEASDEDLPQLLRQYLAGYDAFRRTGETYYWEYEDHGIWGLTARIIRKYLREDPDLNY